MLAKIKNCLPLAEKRFHRGDRVFVQIPTSIVPSTVMLSRTRRLTPVQALARRWLSSGASSNNPPPILYHYFDRPVPYHKGLALQEALVSRRVNAKAALEGHQQDNSKLSPDELERNAALAAEDIILLLQHTPVYTTGRRDTDPEVLKVERERLTAIGADYVATQRGGQTTYHGPGQLVGYPILDTSLLNVRFLSQERVYIRC